MLKKLFTLTNEKIAGGWRGEREFKLVKRVEESSVISSFSFEPTDGQGVPTFLPGQFITLILDNVSDASIRRNYSLSDAPGQSSLRISVKSEPNGVVSNHLHQNLQVGDTVKLTHPAGDFTLRKNNKPLVLVTGGVGITPAISMLNAEAASGREIRFIHAAINSEMHAFKGHVNEVVKNNNNVTPLYVYSDPQQDCQPHATGFITEELIAQQLPDDADVEYYFLGPVPFMKAALNIAKKLAIPEAQVHYEFFGPNEDLTA